MATAFGRRAWYHQLVLLKVQLRSLGKARRHFKERSDRAQLAEEEAGRAAVPCGGAVVREPLSGVATVQGTAGREGGGWIKKKKAHVNLPQWW